MELESTNEIFNREPPCPHPYSKEPWKSALCLVVWMELKINFRLKYIIITSLCHYSNDFSLIIANWLPYISCLWLAMWVRLVLNTTDNLVIFLI